MKKSMKALVVAAGVLSSAAIAQAATVEINIYGASAQYLYWNDAADNFLISKGCSNVLQAQDTGKKHGITEGKACTGFGGNDVTIRYSAKASFESVRSTKGTTNPDNCPTPFERLMASSVAAPNTLVCKAVTLGASDVAGESFVQESHGNLYGPRGGAFTDITLSGEDASGLHAENPLIVPFGFFVNNAVTAKKCAATSSFAGEYCATDADCGGAAGSCGAPSTIDNITRLQAVNIFAGYMADWSDFGAYFTAQPVVACLRHAGSGTHATLDYAVVRGNGWGNLVATYESPDMIWFNEGSSDLIKCVNGNNTVNGTTADDNGSLIGAIGYADADQAVGVANTSQNVKAVKYNGAYGTRYNVRNGNYDFWSTQWVYENKARTTAAQRPVVDALIAFAKVPANVPSTKAKYWATADEMKFFKGTDQEYPFFIGGAVNPQTP
ncbi:hypothetical protein RW64_16575 [Geobacter sulfurreducens]|nr:hypothetical protein RW64_16575 [Geobacter sulfurreducens]